MGHCIGDTVCNSPCGRERTPRGQSADTDDEIGGRFGTFSRELQLHPTASWVAEQSITTPSVGTFVEHGDPLCASLRSHSQVRLALSCGSEGHRSSSPSYTQAVGTGALERWVTGDGWSNGNVKVLVGRGLGR